MLPFILNATWLMHLNDKFSPDDADDEVCGLDVDERDVEQLREFREDEDEQNPGEPVGICCTHQDADLKN